MQKLLTIYLRRVSTICYRKSIYRILNVIIWNIGEKLEWFEQIQYQWTTIILVFLFHYVYSLGYKKKKSLGYLMKAWINKKANQQQLSELTRTRLIKNRCWPLKGRRCIPDVDLKNKGTIVNIYRDINVHVINRYILRPTRIFIYSRRKQTYQYAQYEFKIVYKTWQQKHSGKHVFFFLNS